LEKESPPLAADEPQLIKRAKRGDEQAFRTLMERYRRKVFAIAYGMVREPEAAMDISQEVFIKVHRYLGSFQGTSSFYTWLYRISVNLSIDYLRKVGRQDLVDYDDLLLRREPDDAEAWIVPTVLDGNPHRALDRKELGHEIGKALEKLSEKHRAVLLLREVEGLSYEEIARTLKIHKGTVMSRLHHARKNLQRALREYLKERAGTAASRKKEGASAAEVKKVQDVPGLQG
jgi:RNA polymerase sigma-70 factor (ECF subfamily)